MKHIKKAIAIAIIGVFSAGMLVGCTNTYKQDEVNKLVEDAKARASTESYKSGKNVGYQEGVNSVNVEQAVDVAVTEVISKYEAKEATLKEQITIEKAKTAEEQAEIDRLSAVLEDYKTAEAEILAEQKEFESKKEIELSLGDSFGLKTYNDGQINKLYDDEIEFDGKNYDTHEEVITKASMKVGYSLIDDENFEISPYLITTSNGAIEYKYVFDDPITFADVTRAEPLKISLLGKDITITDVTATEFEIKTGESKWMNVGDSLVFDGKTIKVIAVTLSSDSVGVSVDGNIEWIDENDETQIGDISISVEDIKAIHSNDNSGAAKLTISNVKDVYQVFKDGDSVIYDEDEDDAMFIYKLETSGTNLNAISVQLNQKFDELDDDVTPITLGEAITFPNEYISLKLNSVNVKKYNDVSIEFDDVKNEAKTEYNGIIFNGDDSKSFEIDSETTDRIYAYTTDAGATWSLSYKDSDGKVKDTTDSSFKIVFEDTEYDVSYDAATKAINIDALKILVGLDSANYFAYLGTVKEDSEATELSYSGTNIGTRDNDVLGTNGMIIFNPDNNGENDVVKISVPEDDYKVTVYLG